MYMCIKIITNFIVIFLGTFRITNKCTLQHYIL